MFVEDEILEFFWQIVLGFVSFKYTEKFLQKNFEERKKILVIWILIYAATHFFCPKLRQIFLLTTDF